MATPTPALAPPAHPVERLPEEWEARARAWAEPAYRGRQIFRWIQRERVCDPERMTNVPKPLRARLAQEGLGLPLEIAQVHRSEDRTRKLLLRAPDGREIEAVLIPQLRDADPDEDEEEDEVSPGRVPGRRVTMCISSQVGCAMACSFCASGVAGLKRHLSAAEIVSQVLLGRGQLEGDEALRNVVFMGMGEPLHNYEAVARALVLLSHDQGIGLSTRRVTVSTSGLVPQIDRLGRDFGGRVQLAVSLHSARDEVRSSLMPINRKHSLRELVAALRRYPLPPRRRITMEYTLIEGTNDSLRDADALADLLRAIPSKVNLIPMNPIAGAGFAAPSIASVHAFQARLRARGLACFVRTRRGDEIAAACGQLALHGEPAKVRPRRRDGADPGSE